MRMHSQLLIYNITPQGCLHVFRGERAETIDIYCMHRTHAQPYNFTKKKLFRIHHHGIMRKISHIIITQSATQKKEQRKIY